MIVSKIILSANTTFLAVLLGERFTMNYDVCYIERALA